MGDKELCCQGTHSSQQGCAKKCLFESLSWGSGPSKVVLLLLAPGYTTRSPSSPAQAQISRKTPVLPTTCPPWLPGGGSDRWLKCCNFFFLSRKHKQFHAKRVQPCSLLPLAESPGSPTNVTETAEKENIARPMGPGSKRETYLCMIKPKLPTPQ